MNSNEQGAEYHNRELATAIGPQQLPVGWHLHCACTNPIALPDAAALV
jgi:hypothetical protein